MEHYNNYHLWDEEAGGVGWPEHVDEQVVGQHVQLLHLLTLPTHRLKKDQKRQENPCTCSTKFCFAWHDMHEAKQNTNTLRIKNLRKKYVFSINVRTWTLTLPATPNSSVMPALLTAAETAFTADWMLANSWVRSPKYTICLKHARVLFYLPEDPSNFLRFIKQVRLALLLNSLTCSHLLHNYFNKSATAYLTTSDYSSTAGSLPEAISAWPLQKMSVSQPQL